MHGSKTELQLEVLAALRLLELNATKRALVLELVDKI